MDTPTTSQPTNLPPSFRDSEGREWRLKLSIAVAQAIRDELGVDFGDLDEGRLFLRLGSNPYQLAQVLWMLCEKQCDREEVSPAEFAEGLDGDSIDAALEALIEATVLFTRRPMRAALRKLVETTRAAQEAGLKTTEDWVAKNGSDLTKQCIAETEKELDRLGKSLSK